jgi:hypothetical protein
MRAARTIFGAVVLCLFGVGQAPAGIVGSSDILTSAYVDQLGTWLGRGPLTLTNIFDYKADGSQFDLATAFHTAVDGQGPTFTVMRVGDVVDLVYGFQEYNTNQIIGGYNPLSWTSAEAFNVTQNDADRTAFIYNLTTGEKQDQKLSTNAYGYAGAYQTLNFSGYGPTFGGGADLKVAGIQTGTNLDNRAYNYSYGSEIGIPNFDGNILHFDQGDSNFSISDLEVFTISPGALRTPFAIQVAAVPEPSAVLMACLTGLGFGYRFRRRTAR